MFWFPFYAVVYAGEEITIQQPIIENESQLDITHGGHWLKFKIRIVKPPEIEFPFRLTRVAFTVSRTLNWTLVVPKPHIPPDPHRRVVLLIAPKSPIVPYVLIECPQQVFEKIRLVCYGEYRDVGGEPYAPCYHIEGRFFRLPAYLLLAEPNTLIAITRDVSSMSGSRGTETVHERYAIDWLEVLPDGIIRKHPTEYRTELLKDVVLIGRCYPLHVSPGYAKYLDERASLP